VNGLEADPGRDQRLREIATTITGIIIEITSDAEHAPSFVGTVAEQGYAITTIPLETDSPEMTELGLPKTLQFDLIFIPQMDTSVAAFGVSPMGERPIPEVRESKAFIYLSALPPGAPALATVMPQRLFSSVVEALTRNPDVIVHEVTHMLDHFRGAEFFERVAPPYADTPREDREAFARAYINNPVEFNAHFQQGMFELHQFLTRHATPVQRSQIMANFDNFTAAAIRSQGIFALNAAARGKWSKKLQQRMWQTWKFWREEGL